MMPSRGLLKAFENCIFIFSFILKLEREKREKSLDK
jgi:hypothetical protein